MNVHDIIIKKNNPIYGLSYVPEALNYDNNLDGSFRDFDIEVSQQVFDKISEIVRKNNEQIKTIVEIGVDRRIITLHRKKLDLHSTDALIENKSDSTIFVGIDLDNKSHLNDRKRNIYTIQANSHSQDIVRSCLKNLGVEKISLLMIDGWHSINTVVNDWRYVDLLDEKGIVLFHDVNYHSGPYHVLQAIDKNLFEVKNYFPNQADYGLGAAFKK